MNSLLFFTVMQVLMANEGFESKPYQVRGVWHIGYGYNLEARMPNPPCGDYKCLLWSKADAFYQLEMDVRQIHTRLRVRYQCYNQLPLKGKLVMVDMAYNIGVGGLFKFKELLVSLCVKNYKKAGEDILDSDYANDVPNRARRNANTITEGYDL